MTPARDEHRISAYCESLADEAEVATEERKAKTEASRLEFDALMDKLRAASQPPSHSFVCGITFGTPDALSSGMIVQTALHATARARMGIFGA